MTKSTQPSPDPLEKPEIELPTVFASERDALEAQLESLKAHLLALQRELGQVIERMRSDRPRYKSHDLGFVDSVGASTVEDWADELELISGRLLAPATKE